MSKAIYCKDCRWFRAFIGGHYGCAHPSNQIQHPVAPKLGDCERINSDNDCEKADSYVWWHAFWRPSK